MPATISAGELITWRIRTASLWHKASRSRRCTWLEAALTAPPRGNHTLPGCDCLRCTREASNTADTDWTQIIGLYDYLLCSANLTPGHRAEPPVACGHARMGRGRVWPARRTQRLPSACRTTKFVARRARRSVAPFRSADQLLASLSTTHCDWSSSGRNTLSAEGGLDALELAAIQTDKSAKNLEGCRFRVLLPDSIHVAPINVQTMGRRT